MSKNDFASRHLGPRENDIQEMLSTLGEDSLNSFTAKVVPANIILNSRLNVPEALTEVEALSELRSYASENKVFRSYLGQGYYGTLTPGVIQRTILENPCWYTQYTPYQAEISQGRLEALLNFQTLVCDLTGLDLANASLLDEATAVAEAMTLSYRVNHKKLGAKVLVHTGLHTQSLEVLQTRAEPLGIEVGSFSDASGLGDLNGVFAVIIQSPSTDGDLLNVAEYSAKVKATGAHLVVASDLLALTLVEAPGKLGADVVVGSAQRFGVPLGFGGPHAAFMSTSAEYQREIPGRLIGVSKDADGKRALRLALQTREQHIKRERATSNICTAQVLLAIMASMYAVYHGPKGLKEIAKGINLKTKTLKASLEKAGVGVINKNYFDTIRTVSLNNVAEIKKKAEAKEINLRYFSDSSIGISLDETVSDSDLSDLASLFGASILSADGGAIGAEFERKSSFLTDKVFNSYHSETELLRYITKLQNRDLSLAHSMIPLGSCTMKLNATSEMVPVSWREFSTMHPFAPKEQSLGYQKMFMDLENWIGDVTGLPGVSLQPNSGAQGEYAGLMVVRSYFKEKGDLARNVCLIPASAHGTNPASADMAGLKVVVVKCDSSGNVDLEDLEAKVKEYGNALMVLMVTYPSTHGVFEAGIKKMCELVHDVGGLVYMDGANLNAQVGLCRAGEFGADVCHLNLHKTFCIPHGGGGPGMGPIAVTNMLKPHLPGSKAADVKGSGAVSAAPYGSASILPISWMYMRMMGPDNLRKATQVAILNANYIAKKLEGHYDVLYRGANNFVAHECILDLRHLKKTVGIDVTDIAKRLMDYGFHAPTVSFPVVETLMVEPTESESKEELDRFCEALISIKKEIDEVSSGLVKAEESPLKNAPHTAERLTQAEWPFKYSREKAVFPLSWVKENKFWPHVSRIDNAYGDRNLFCVCGSPEDYKE